MMASRVKRMAMPVADRRHRGIASLLLVQARSAG